MPTLRFSINQRTSKELAEAAKEQIAEKVLERARDNFKSKFKPGLAEVIDDAIYKNAENFIPSNNEAYELGIGEGGSISEFREKAWQNLLISSNREIIKITSRKGEGKTGIGNFQISIDYEKFYAQPEANIDTPDSDEIDSIPWMRWFIEGAEVSKYHFQENKKSKVSRTGGGIMVQGGLWQFRPQFHIINQLHSTISILIKDYINKFVAEELAD